MEQRDYSKFFTPPGIAARMADLLEAKPGQYILEPSAGNGALAKALKNIDKNINVHAIEQDDRYKLDLEAICDSVIIHDFLDIDFGLSQYDGCLANPPFGNLTDVKAHYDKIRSIVKPEGNIVMIVPQDFRPDVSYISYDIWNWAVNKDGSVTYIKVIDFVNP